METLFWGQHVIKKVQKSQTEVPNLAQIQSCTDIFHYVQGWVYHKYTIVHWDIQSILTYWTEHFQRCEWGLNICFIVCGLSGPCPLCFGSIELSFQMLHMFLLFHLQRCISPLESCITAFIWISCSPQIHPGILAQTKESCIEHLTSQQTSWLRWSRN